LSHYKSAIEILQAQLKGKGKLPADEDSENAELELRKNVAHAFVGMVEIWMDPRYDLWSVHCHGMRARPLKDRSFDPAAERNCEELLDAALQIDPCNSEALQALASVRM
jgi:hypothetical protein